MKIKEIRILIETEKSRSAWSKGVKEYALELLEELPENMELYRSPADLKTLLNGAESWEQYSSGGCALIYNKDIAKRLCSPSEFKKSINGERNPNSQEDWIDVQTRALYQAEILIRRVIKEYTVS